MKKLSNEELLAELEVPFPVDPVLWRVINTAEPRATQEIPDFLMPTGWHPPYRILPSNF